MLVPIDARCLRCGFKLAWRVITGRKSILALLWLVLFLPLYTPSVYPLGERQAQYGLVIVKRGNSYYWASREMKPLIRTVSGAFHYFTDPNGGGYIKVVDRRLLMEKKNPRYLYMEQLTLWMQTITYWGTADAFSP